jgi:hypothetical protein
MQRSFAFLLASALVTLGSAQTALAENSANIRDCAFGVPPAGVDGDFVMITGSTLKAVDPTNGPLIALPSQNIVHLTASESLDASDHTSSNVVHITATVSAPGVAPQTFSNNGIGWTTVQLPLNGSSPGVVYTISWNATFDGGGHSCPSAVTPQNTGPNPFVIKIVKSQ